MSAPNTFQAIPGQDDLQQIPRDLSFHPSGTTDPKTLTREQVEHYNRHGYVKPLDIFTAGEADELRRYFDDLLRRYVAEGKDSYSISSAHLRHGRVWDVLTNPKIVAVVSDLLGPSVVAWGSHFFCKMPRDGKTVSWHQDASYWPLTPSKAVTVWLAIDDADRGNACMKYIPGTQGLGHLTYQLSETDESNVLNQTVPEVERYGAPVYVELKAGQASLHSDLLLHGSEANTSDRRRCGLTLRYTTGDVRAHMGWHEKGVVVAGAPPAHWGNRPRPTEE
ncbi:phytanoyl-CoA dioxygenase family protein [Gemmata sp. JC673]|uniref:Phytanoyl-CoA dioxygenase family protein n=1 Tax=Gemmata algarum TaxID=2975278 RepID=A0ABU5F148_9BACT|nr:phytanoyl-CoA dioxygenase family protein [Gemmata algarum]MDY3561307.1 phytanoyl-CoA dioxygenase family protein [Gemmata algarum]